jgi:hypothetical protein
MTRTSSPTIRYRTRTTRDADIAGWLDALREATTVPWFTLLDQDEIVRTGDAAILLDWTRAVPCTSHPGQRQPPRPRRTVKPLLARGFRRWSTATRWSPRCQWPKPRTGGG